MPQARLAARGRALVLPKRCRCRGGSAATALRGVLTAAAGRSAALRTATATEAADRGDGGQGHASAADRAGGEPVPASAPVGQHADGHRRAGLVRTRRDGTRVYYSMASDHVGALWRAMRDVAGEHVTAVDTFRRD